MAGRALACFHAEPVDLVITDIIMPDSEGLETIIALHRERPALPIIAMSDGAAYSSLYLTVATKLGARGAFTKPFASAVLLRAIDKTPRAATRPSCRLQMKFSPP